MQETRPKTFVFVLMPFSDDFLDVYEVGIKAACKDAGAYCERVDEQLFTENILGRIYNQIAKADVIVADMSGQNPNVFYETGYAHALNKQVILVTKAAKDIPFDLKYYPHVVYESKIALLKIELEKRVRWCIENPKDSLSKVDLDLQFLINGLAITENPAVELHSNYGRLRIDIHNPTGRVVNPQSYKLALIMPGKASLRDVNVLSAARLPDGRYIFTLDHPHSIFPFGWLSLEVYFEFGGPGWDKRKEMTLRFFTEFGFKDYPFTAKPDR